MDYLRGKALRVLEGETFLLVITDNPDENDYVYGATEIIRLKDGGAPPADTPEGEESRQGLEGFLMGWELIMEVYGKDAEGRFIADVYRDEE